MGERPFTKADVDYLVSASKFIRATPNPTRDGGFWKIEARVYRKDQPNAPVVGLLVMARIVANPLAGLPRPIPSAALNFHGYRVRGIDRYLQHDNPDGTRLTGWHEHIWSDLERDTYAVPIREPKHKDLRGVFAAALERWNIEIQKPQIEV